MDEDLAMVFDGIATAERRIRRMIDKGASLSVIQREMDWAQTLQARRRTILCHRYREIIARQMEGAR